MDTLLISSSTIPEINDILTFWFGINDEWKGNLWFHGIDVKAMKKDQLQNNSNHQSHKQNKRNVQKDTDNYILMKYGKLINILINSETNEIKEEYKDTDWFKTIHGKCALIILSQTILLIFNPFLLFIFYYD